MLQNMSFVFDGKDAVGIKRPHMPTMRERETVAKLILLVRNALDESRRELTDHGRDERRPEYTLEQLRPLAADAIEEAQRMLASWGK